MDHLLIKHRLLDRGWSLADLARRLAVPYDRMIKIVNGYRRAHPAEIAAIAKALGVEPERLDLHQRELGNQAEQD